MGSQVWHRIAFADGAVTDMDATGQIWPKLTSTAGAIFMVQDRVTRAGKPQVRPGDSLKYQ